MSDIPANFCPACGNHLPGDAHFCPVCGHQISGATESAAPAPPPTPPTPPPTGPPPPVVAPTPPLAPIPNAPTTGGRSRSALLVVIGVLTTLLVVGTVVGVGYVIVSNRSAAADEVTLEPIGYVPPDPFTASVSAAAEQTPKAGAVKVTPPAGGTQGGQSVAGSQAGLYGGTTNNATCDPEKLIGFLQANPDKGNAWAGVLGINPADIPTYVRALTPVTLTRDTKVTNHGFANGKATTIPAVLQAGTAVMVDRFGVPRVKCGCGNPLTEPAAITTQTTFRGTQWIGFTTTTLVQVTINVEVNVFVLVDPQTGTVFDRPPGNSVGNDRPIPPDEACRQFPADPSCQPGGASTTTTAAPTTTTTVPPTAPPTARPTTTPAPTVAPTVTSGGNGARSAEAANWVRQAIQSCTPDSQYVTSITAREGNRDTLYLVDAHIVLDSGDWYAHYEVDFATEDFPEIRPLDSASAPMICR